MLGRFCDAGRPVSRLHGETNRVRILASFPQLQEVMASEPAPPFTTALLAPKYWPAWLGVVLLRSTVWLPQRARMALGAGLGRIYLSRSGKRRRVVETNLRLCFPERSDEEREALLRRHFESMGKGILELALAWWGRDAQVRPLGRIEGKAHVTRALAEGKGIIFFSAHFTSVEISGRLMKLLAPELPIHIMYRPNEHPVLNRVMVERRSRQIARPIPRHDMRSMLKALKGGQIVWYAADQNYGHKNSVFADFFGIPAATNTAISRLAGHENVVVIPFFCARRADESGYDIEISPPLAPFPGDDPQQDATRLNAIIEGWARRYPEQYFWVHRRFKDRPEGEERFY